MDEITLRQNTLNRDVEKNVREKHADAFFYLPFPSNRKLGKSILFDMDLIKNTIFERGVSSSGRKLENSNVESKKGNIKK